jgi:hypothetical protein
MKTLPARISSSPLFFEAKEAQGSEKMCTIMVLVCVCLGEKKCHKYMGCDRARNIHQRSSGDGATACASGLLMMLYTKERSALFLMTSSVANTLIHLPPKHTAGKKRHLCGEPLFCLARPPGK